MLKLTSLAIDAENKMDVFYGCKGPEENMKYGIPQTSFPLKWEGAPEETKSYAIIFIDYDNAEDEGVPWVHWLVSDIPADVSEIPENASRKEGFYPQGRSSWATRLGEYKDIPIEYSYFFGGPAPEREHAYEIWLYALDIVPGLKDGFWINDLRKAMKGHVLEETCLIGLYG